MTTLAQAVLELTHKHKAQFCLEIDKAAPTGESWVRLVSGGAAHPRDPVYPVLCLDEERAVELWAATVREYAEVAGNGKLYWRGEPRLLAFATTIADLPVQTQRRVETRYVVSADLLISDAPTDT
jgi:hypothetical protein